MKGVQNKHYLIEFNVILYLELLQQNEYLVVVYYPIVIGIHRMEDGAQPTQFFAVLSQDVL